MSAGDPETVGAAVVPARVVGTDAVSLRITPTPGTLLPPSELAKGIARFGALMDALSEEEGAAVEWRVCDLAVAADGAATISLLPVAS